MCNTLMMHRTKKKILHLDDTHINGRIHAREHERVQIYVYAKNFAHLGIFGFKLRML